MEKALIAVPFLNQLTKEIFNLAKSLAKAK
jgi:hypothetical protein